MLTKFVVVSFSFCFNSNSFDLCKRRTLNTPKYTDRMIKLWIIVCSINKKKDFKHKILAFCISLRYSTLTRQFWAYSVHIFTFRLNFGMPHTAQHDFHITNVPQVCRQQNWRKWRTPLWKRFDYNNQISSQKFPDDLIVN